MRREIADDQPRGAGAEAVLAHRSSRRRREAGRVGEPEVIVGREVDDPAAVDRRARRPGRRRSRASGGVDRRLRARTSSAAMFHVERSSTMSCLVGLPYVPRGTLAPTAPTHQTLCLRQRLDPAGRAADRVLDRRLARESSRRLEDRRIRGLHRDHQPARTDQSRRRARATPADPRSRATRRRRRSDRSLRHGRWSGSRFGATVRLRVCRNATFLATASMQVTASEGRAIASTAPGNPAPLPTSISVAHSRTSGTTARLSRKCSSTAVALLGDRGQVDLAVPGLQQREVLDELVDLRASSATPSSRAPATSRSFVALSTRRSVVFRTMPHLSPDDLARTIFPVAVELSGGGQNPRVETLAGGASIRRYHRVTLDGGKLPTVMVMELGDNPLKSEEAAKGARARRAPVHQRAALPRARWRRGAGDLSLRRRARPRVPRRSRRRHLRVARRRRRRRRARALLSAGDRSARGAAALRRGPSRSRLRRLLARLRLRAPEVGARSLPRVRPRGAGHRADRRRSARRSSASSAASPRSSPPSRAASSIATTRAAT